MPMVPLKNPDAAPVASVAAVPGIVRKAKPRQSRAVAVPAKMAKPIFMGAAGIDANIHTPMGVAMAQPISNKMIDRQCTSRQMPGNN